MSMTGADLLIVDDTQENILVLRNLLKGEGFQVRAVKNGEAALRAIKSKVPNLIMLDIMMPGMDGFELCSAIKAIPAASQVPILFISALSQVQDKVKGFQAGAVDFITKPFQAEEVLARVRTHLELQHSRELLEAQNRELIEASALREDVERILRHDLKGPLTNIIGFSELLLKHGNLDQDNEEYARIVYHGGYRMLDMVNASFDLMKMERGDYHFIPKVLDLGDLFSLLVGEFKTLAEANDNALNLTISPECDGSDSRCCLALGDELLCHSLFGNLVKNALEASPRGGAVEVRLFSDNQVVIEIRNQGEVPLEIRERFFEKYTTSGKEHGTGLGTYSALLMAKTQGGDIELDCSESGYTTVRIFLKVASRISQIHINDSFSSVGVENPISDSSMFDRVLLVDDDDGTRLFLKTHLPDFISEVAEACNGQEALDIFTRGCHPFVVMDVNMPVLGGLEAARQMRDWEKSQPEDYDAAYILGLSAAVDDSTLRECLAAGYDNLLSKPIAGADFHNKVQRLLKGGTSIPFGETVTVDRSLQDILPATLESWMTTLSEIENLVRVSGESQKIEALSHRLAGSLNMYGFKKAGKIAAYLEKEAEKLDDSTLLLTLESLRNDIAKAVITFE